MLHAKSQDHPRGVGIGACHGVVRGGQIVIADKFLSEINHEWAEIFKIGVFSEYTTDVYAWEAILCLGI